MMITAFYLSFLTPIYPILILPPCLCQYITLKYIAFDQNKKQIPHYDDHCILFIIFNPYLSHPHSASLSVSVYNT